MAEYKTRILSTRPLEPSLLEQAAARGIIVDMLSFIETAPLTDESLSSRIDELAQRPIVAVFTSMNAVEAVARQLIQAAPSVERTPNQPPLPWRIYCIGHATQLLIREFFADACIAGTADSAAALADTIIGQEAAEVYFFCGDQRREELPEKLRQQEIRVNELVVYKTLQTPHKVEHRYDGIVFFSPSAVHSFFSDNTIAADTLLFAIGQTTAHTIRAYSSNRTILSGSPEKEVLIRQVIDYFQDHPTIAHNNKP